MVPGVEEGLLSPLIVEGCIPVLCDGLVVFCFEVSGAVAGGVGCD